MTAPVVGQVVAAETLPATLGAPTQRARVEVTAIEGDTGGGWVIWGHRQYPTRRRGVRQTMYPRQYFLPKPTAHQPVSEVD